MMREMLWRTASMLVIIWLAATLAFWALAALPGDAIETQLVQSGADPAVIEERRAALGLTDPVGTRYLRFLLNAVRGDLGVSLISGEPVIEAVIRNFQPTLALALGALVVAVVAGVLMGLAGVVRVPLLSFLSDLLTGLALSMPIYWTGTVAIYVFTVQLNLLPSAGAGRLSQLVLPVLVLGFHTAGAIARVTRGNIEEVMAADFVRMARAKGLRERRIVGVHVLRAALPPVISVIALQAGFLLSGTVITESLFVRPGIGRLLLDGVIQQDYPVVLGVVVLSAVVYAAASLAADVTVRILDPRVTS